MSIPLARQRLREVIEKTDPVTAALLRDILPLMYRRTRVKQARAKARPITPTLARQIRQFAARHPDLPNREIGRVFDVDGGRVSEVLQGDRT